MSCFYGWILIAKKQVDRYEVIRAGSIRIFMSKGVSDAEYYTDEAIDRVIKRLPEIQVRLRRRSGALLSWRSAEHRSGSWPASGSRHGRVAGSSPACILLKAIHRTVCRNACNFLPRDKLEFILDYHLYQGREKIVHHRQMASELSITGRCIANASAPPALESGKMRNRCVDHPQNKSGGLKS